MRVIRVENCRVEAAFCNLRCPYCTHLDAESFDESVDEIAEKLDNCEKVYIGGAEPTVHRDLEDLLKKLKGKKITLKTSGFLPDVVERIANYVDMFVVEVKGDFDDLDKLSALTGLSRERAKKYVENVLKTIEIVKRREKKLRLWARIIRGYLDAKTLEKVLKKVGEVDEVLVYQYLSNPEWDREVEFLDPPSYEEVLEAGKVAKKFAKRVVVVGERREEI